MSELIADLAWTDALGMVGVAAYIGSYFALQAGFIRGQGYVYASLNAFAAICVLLSLVSAFNLSSAVIQVTYICISIFGMIRFYLLSHRIRFTEEEKMFLAVAAPALPEVQARKLLNQGIWSSMVSGTILTEHGEVPENLHFILEGHATVTVNGKSVASIEDHSLVGEMSCLTGMPASATVILDQQSRVLSIRIDALNAFLERNPDARLELQGRFAAQVSAKLVKANAVLSADPVAG